MPVLCNAGPLIALGKLNRLPLLIHLYPELAIPRTVYHEVVVKGMALGASDAAAARLFVERYGCPVVEASEAVIADYTPRVMLDAGERELLALAKADRRSLVLMDDELARAEARFLGLSVKGTLGTLVQAHREGLLTLDEVEWLLLAIAARPDIWISEKLCQQVLDRLAHLP